MKKSPRLYSILYNKCPRCQEGNVFESNNPYNLRKFAIMHKTCPQCGMDFRQEPGFYFGATYVSYVMQVAIVLGLSLLLYVELDWSVWAYAGACAGLLLLLLPLTFRISRLIWLTLFGDKGKSRKDKFQ